MSEKYRALPNAVFHRSPSSSVTFLMLFPSSHVAVLWNAFDPMMTYRPGARFRPTGIRVRVRRTESLA